ncbi:MAG: hypothetical protein A4E62_02974 [Syntrophorhabdus sp. PtaU1.Bin002]|nr:MAG: hypothetical protein A4E62_02974 [Syntrophorhabdus sp. PtaU1.Bin002]
MFLDHIKHPLVENIDRFIELDYLVCFDVRIEEFFYFRFIIAIVDGFRVPQFDGGFQIMKPFQIVPVLGYLGVRGIYDKPFRRKCHGQYLTILGQPSVELLPQGHVAKE